RRIDGSCVGIYAALGEDVEKPGTRKRPVYEYLGFAVIEQQRRDSQPRHRDTFGGFAGGGSDGPAEGGGVRPFLPLPDDERDEGHSQEEQGARTDRYPAPRLLHVAAALISQASLPRCQARKVCGDGRNVVAERIANQ